MAHAVLLLLMLEAVHADLVHHQPETQHPKSSAIHKLPADYPIFWVHSDRMVLCRGLLRLTAIGSLAWSVCLPTRPRSWDGEGVMVVAGTFLRRDLRSKPNKVPVLMAGCDRHLRPIDDRIHSGEVRSACGNTALGRRR